MRPCGTMTSSRWGYCLRMASTSTRSVSMRWPDEWWKYSRLVWSSWDCTVKLLPVILAAGRRGT
jgi:hypothetical protein